MISRALLNAPFFIPKDADLLRNRKVNTKKRQNRHLPELAFLILGTYFTAPLLDIEPIFQKLPKNFSVPFKFYIVKFNFLSPTDIFQEFYIIFHIEHLSVFFYQNQFSPFLVDKII